MKRSGDWKNEFTAETRRRGENQKPTTESRRHGEESGDRVIARDHPSRAKAARAGGPGDRVIGGAACPCHPLYPCHPERARVERSETSESRRTPRMSVPKHAASGSSYEAANLTAEAQRRGERSGDRVIARDRVIGKTRSFFTTVRATLREIFDESAYDRFLVRTNAGRSIASYRDFTRERDASMLKKPRCC